MDELILNPRETNFILLNNRLKKAIDMINGGDIKGAISEIELVNRKLEYNSRYTPQFEIPEHVIIEADSRGKYDDVFEDIQELVAKIDACELQIGILHRMCDEKLAEFQEVIEQYKSMKSVFQDYDEEKEKDKIKENIKKQIEIYRKNMNDAKAELNTLIDNNPTFKNYADHIKSMIADSE
jgi:hypothetical protein